MIVEIDDKSGFCFGVVRAISMAEKALTESGKVYCVGNIVHNRVEVSRLERMGLECLSAGIIDSHREKTILIRAHGEPPSTYTSAKDNSNTIIDATCPVVAALQNHIKTAYAKMSPLGGQVIILGKKGHAEVVGLNGQIDNKGIIVESVEDLHKYVSFDKPIYMLSQTTKSLSLFEDIKNEILINTDGTELLVVIRDTICRQVSNRNPNLKKFAARFDLVLFVSGADSSNGTALYDVCLSENPNSYKIEDQKDIRSEWFKGADSVGICGATSTPKWLMDDIADFVRNEEFL